MSEVGSEWNATRPPEACSCEWRLADTGTEFHLRRVKADPNCPIPGHKETPGR